MAVNDKGRTGPTLGPRRAVGGVGAFAGAAFSIDHLNTGDDGNRLFLPRFSGKETSVDDDEIEIGNLVSERHFFQVGPVVGLEGVKGLLVVVLEQGAILSGAVGEETGLMVAEHGEGVVAQGEVDDPGAVRAAIDEIADENEAIIGREGETVEEFGEFLVTSVDVADGDNATVHACECGKVLASPGGGGKQERPQIFMELTLQSLSSRCHVTGRPFADGERVVSFLNRATGAAAGPEGIVRSDVLEAEQGNFMAPGPLVCRWVQIFKARRVLENPERTLKLTAESLFLALNDPANERTVENDRLLQVLAMMLERKRVLRAKGRTPDQRRFRYEHAKNKTMHEVEAAELNPEFFLSIQSQLAALVGGAPAAAAEGASAPSGA